MSFWTSERDAQITQMWADGLTCSQIANRVKAVSRNAVIGRVRRLGLPFRPQSGGTQAGKKYKARRAPRPLRPVSTAQAIRCDGLPIPTPAETDIPRVSLDDLTDRHCRWPCWDGRAPNPDVPSACGLEPLPGQKYCRAHYVRAYVPVRTREQSAPRVVEKELEVA